jgi:glycerol-3-phosphate dehydrogenase
MSQLLRLTPVLNRQQTIAALSGEFDAIVIGGGINGAVSTAALAAHGINVVLVESNDFASMTSQESSNMIWGGIKYLQDYEFSLVWSLCRSRNELLSKYPNRIQEIPFFAVINQNSPFSRALGYVGSLLYWFFGSFKTNKPRVFSTQKIRGLNPQLDMDRVKGAIQYNDAILLDNDARFVYEFIKTGAKLGAKVLNYAEVTKATSTTDGWLVNVRDKLSGSYFEVKAKT